MTEKTNAKLRMRVSAQASLEDAVNRALRAMDYSAGDVRRIVSAEIERTLSDWRNALRYHGEPDPAPETPPVRWGYTGWDSGDDVDPPEPGKEWLTIGYLDDAGFFDEEVAIIVLRTDAKIFRDNPQSLVEARERDEKAAARIVEALNFYESNQLDQEEA